MHEKDKEVKTHSRKEIKKLLVSNCIWIIYLNINMNPVQLLVFYINDLKLKMAQKELSIDTSV
jgi:hypothetical protein